MTEQERKEAIEKLEHLRKQGILSDAEYIQKVSSLKAETVKKDVNTKPIAIFLIILVIIICAVAVINQQSDNSYSSGSSTRTSSQTSTSKTYMSQDDKADAMTYAQAYVKTQLKAPSTAKFPSSLSQYTFSRNGDQYTVKGYVDAQNSFGAQIRSKFECCFTMTKNQGKIQTKLIYINID